MDSAFLDFPCLVRYQRPCGEVIAMPQVKIMVPMVYLLIVFWGRRHP